MKLKKGDRIWLLVPMNGTIKRVNKKRGYTVILDDLEKSSESAYYGDSEVKKLPTKEEKE